MINPITKEHATRLYTRDGWSLEKIAEKLKISNNTLRIWKEKSNWDVLRKEFLNSSQNFTAEMTAFAMQIAADIRLDYLNNKNIDKDMSTFLLNLLARTKELIILETERAKSTKLNQLRTKDAEYSESHQAILTSDESEVRGLSLFPKSIPDSSLLC